MHSGIQDHALCLASGRRTDHHNDLLPVDQEAEDVDLPVDDPSAHHLAAIALHPASNLGREWRVVLNTNIRSRIGFPCNVLALEGA